MCCLKIPYILWGFWEISNQQQNRLYPSNSKTRIIKIPNTSLGRKIMIAIPTAIQNSIKPISRFMPSPEKEHILLLNICPLPEKIPSA